MYLRRSRDLNRAGFTLIELIVVIAIIAILVSLSAAAVIRILIKIPETQTRSDIAMMDSALANFMADYKLQDPPPSVLVLYETNPLQGPSAPFLEKMFGRNLGAGQPFVDWNGDGTPNGPWLLEGEQCLVFYLGGIPNMGVVAAGGNPQCQGFSTNNYNPAVISANVKVRGPYFQFQTARLKPLTALNPNAKSPFFVYIDAWQVSEWPPSIPAGYTLRFPKPYAYFSSQGRNNTGYTQAPLESGGLLSAGQDCLSLGAAPYRDAAGQFTFSNKYQIISAGQNGVFGTGVWNPMAGAQDPFGKDDQANFSSKPLGNGQQ